MDTNMIIIKTDLESASTKLLKNHKKISTSGRTMYRRMSCLSKTAIIDFSK